MDKELRSKQQQMHRSVFDRVKLAMENGFYLEAVFLEYAAIEGRLEVMLGVLGMPCNKDLPAGTRKSVQISHRVSCLKTIYQTHASVLSGKVTAKDYAKLKSWLDKRNQYVHGLYKDAAKYSSRNAAARALAEKGYKHMDLLYCETKRLRKLRTAGKLIELSPACKSDSCNLNPEKQKEEQK